MRKRLRLGNSKGKQFTSQISTVHDFEPRKLLHKMRTVHLGQTSKAPLLWRYQKNVSFKIPKDPTLVSPNACVGACACPCKRVQYNRCSFSGKHFAEQTLLRCCTLLQATASCRFDRLRKHKLYIKKKPKNTIAPSPNLDQMKVSVDLRKAQT